MSARISSMSRPGAGERAAVRSDAQVSCRARSLRLSRTFFERSRRDGAGSAQALARERSGAVLAAGRGAVAGAAIVVLDAALSGEGGISAERDARLFPAHSVPEVPPYLQGMRNFAFSGPCRRNPICCINCL